MPSLYCPCLQNTWSNSSDICSKSFTNYHACIKLYVAIPSKITNTLLYSNLAITLFLMKDIVNLERIQCRATKHILNEYTSCYKDRLLNLKLLSLMQLHIQTAGHSYCLLSSYQNLQLISSTSIILSVSILQLLGLELVTNFDTTTS